MKKILIALIFILFAPSVSFSGTAINPETGGLDVTIDIQEEDGDPTGYAPTTLKVTNGTLTDNGDGTYSLVTGGGAGGGDLKADGSVPLTSDWDAGDSSYDITAVEFKGALIGNADTCTTASEGDVALNFFGAGVTAVTDGTACTDIEGTSLSIAGGTLNVDDDFLKLGGDIASAGTYDFGEASVILEIPNAGADVALGNAGEMHLNTTDDQLSFHMGAAGEVQGEASISLLRHVAVTFDPKAVSDLTIDRLFIMSVGDDSPEGITIVEWRLSFDADPTTEFGAGETLFKRATAMIGVGSTNTMDDLATSSGVSSEDTAANINGGDVVANEQVLYIDFPTAYTEAGHSVLFEFWFYNMES